MGNGFGRHIGAMVAMAGAPVLGLIVGLIAYFGFHAGWLMAVIIGVVVAAVLGFLAFAFAGVNMARMVKDPSTMLDSTPRRFPRR